MNRELARLTRFHGKAHGACAGSIEGDQSQLVMSCAEHQMHLGRDLAGIDLVDHDSGRRIGRDVEVSGIAIGRDVEVSGIAASNSRDIGDGG